MFCKKCGTQMEDTATVCPSCGTPSQETGAPVSAPVAVESQPSFWKKLLVTLKKVKPIWYIVGAVVLVLAILAGILFMPRDLDLDDFDTTSTIGAVFTFGLPEEFDTTDEGETVLHYWDAVDFYGITPNAFMVYPDDNCFAFFFQEEDKYDVRDLLDVHCRREDGSIYDYYYYDNLKITTSGTYVSIEAFD